MSKKKELLHLFFEERNKLLYQDETALSQGELYTLITNKNAKGKKRGLEAILSGRKVEPIVEPLLKYQLPCRNKVQEITLDIALSIKLIEKKCSQKQYR